MSFRFLMPLLAALTCLEAACLSAPEPYFDTATAPRLSALVNVTSGEGAFEVGTMGGALVRLEGDQLSGENLSVRFGDRNATILTQEVDPGGLAVTVRTPVGPVSGGSVDVSLSHDDGVTVLRGAYEYRLPDATVFGREVGSLQLIGYGGGGYDGALSFWSSTRPRQAGSMLLPGALFYLPVDVNSPVLWDTSVAPPALPVLSDLAVAEVVSLTAEGRTDLAPFTFARDPLDGRWRLCPPQPGTTLEFASGVPFTLEAAGGAIQAPIRESLVVPPMPFDGAVSPTLHPVYFTVGGRSVQVAQINQLADVRVTLPTLTDVVADASYLLVELVVEAVDVSLPDQPLEVARLGIRADDAEGGFDLSSADLALLPEVNTQCALLGRDLASVRLSGASSEPEVLERYLSVGCEDPENPLGTYPYQAWIRLSRHYLHRIPLGAGVGGCLNPGHCDGSGELVVDLVASYQLPASLLTLPVTECADQLDNDSDGEVDNDDPGCSGYLDESELDESGNYPCDNGKDDDGDGYSDYRQAKGRDPGCTSTRDASEQSTAQCDDGLDNDGDGVIDYRPQGKGGDVGCTSPDGLVDNDEHELTLPCDDGVDNDGDGTLDYRSTLGVGDPGCAGLDDQSEFDETGRYLCDDGVDTDIDQTAEVPVVRTSFYDQEDHGCWGDPKDPATYTPYELDEFNLTVQCDNGYNDDPDQDMLVDYRADGSGDPQCKTALDPYEDK